MEKKLNFVETSISFINREVCYFWEESKCTYEGAVDTKVGKIINKNTAGEQLLFLIRLGVQPIATSQKS